MNNVTEDIVAKLWNLCNVLKDDGVTYRYRGATEGGAVPQESLTAGMTSRPNEDSVAGAAKSVNQT